MASINVEKVDDKVEALREHVYQLGLYVDDLVFTILKVLKDEELLTYDQYYDLRDTLRELRELLEKIFEEEEE